MSWARAPLDQQPEASLQAVLHCAAVPPLQASGTLPAGSEVSALLIGDLMSMPVTSIPPVTVLPAQLG